jgi:hypothetical protein
MASGQGMTISRLGNFSRRVDHRFSRMSQFEVERQAYLLRNKLQHVSRGKSVALLIGMLRDLENRRPVSSSKMDRVLLNLREISASSSTTRGGGMIGKIFGQPAVASILLTSHFIKQKSVFR